MIGLGGASPSLLMYIANRPVGARYESLKTYEPLLAGELQSIVANNSNHWRKAFNVYAKVLWQLDWLRKSGSGDKSSMPSATSVNSWQEYRDSHLLQAHSREAMLFSSPDFSKTQTSNPRNSQSLNSTLNGVTIHWVVGKTYAAALALPALTWLDAHFAINREYRLIVSPYVDYRQLTNERIAQFADIYSQLVNQR